MTLSSGEPSAVGGRHRVVIIGSGFGGLNAAKALKRADVDITLISKTTTHLFQPLLYQVATGILSEGDIAPTTRLILRRQKNVRVLLGEVNAIDLKAQTVTSKLMDMTTVTPYDSLIVAAGAQQSYFGNDEFATFAPGMKTIDDALELRGRILGAFEVAEVTTDWTFSHGRDWGSPKIPEEMNLKTILRLSPEAITRPRWLWKFAKTLRPPDLRVPNQGRRGEPGPPFFAAYGEWMATPPPTWEDIGWLRELWGGPFMLKGVMRVDDAKRAVDAGVSAISVSNHGGNNLDGTPASIRALPAVSAAVGDQVEVLLDGGIRRGSDVVKAVALGARAVMIGRAYLWGLAANGQAGVENVLDILRGGIDSALMGLGHASVHDLSPADILVPTGFIRDLGVPSRRDV